MFQDFIPSANCLQIGLAHGKEAAAEVSGSIAFYAGLFARDAKLDWAGVRTITTRDFKPVIAVHWPDFLAEMHGIAVGAGVPLEDIIALNVRTEIAFGLFSDGCTMLAWHGDGAAYIAQNWDVSGRILLEGKRPDTNVSLVDDCPATESHFPYHYQTLFTHHQDGHRRRHYW